MALQSDVGTMTTAVLPGAPVSGQSGVPRQEVRRILDLKVPVSVILAERDMTVASVLDIAVGSIVEFDVPFDADLILQVVGHPIGLGQAVKVGENFGLRIASIDDVQHRIGALKGE